MIANLLEVSPSWHKKLEIQNLFKASISNSNSSKPVEANLQSWTPKTNCFTLNKVIDYQKVSIDPRKVKKNLLMLSSKSLKSKKKNIIDEK